jgi:hypothetical protein
MSIDGFRAIDRSMRRIIRTSAFASPTSSARARLSSRLRSAAVPSRG